MNPDPAIEALIRRVSRVTEEMDAAMREAIASGNRPMTRQTSRWLASLRVGLKDVRDARHLPYAKPAPSLRDQITASLAQEGEAA